ncbi:HAD-superfamily hydrolase [Hypoxylon crocopeplum]|nr:HAD-superfamily hydrolase [Hypoxylon crocopeplum]
MLDPGQFIQSHTPYLDLVPEYRDKTILAIGGHGQQIRKLAHDYGFKNVVISSDFVAQLKHIHPFPEISKGHHEEHGCCDINLRSTPISAILVWTSPRDWCLDLQLISDLLQSEGGLIDKRRSPKNNGRSFPNDGFLQDGQPKLYFCNPDFEWSTEHEQPRFAQGAFRAALEGVWSDRTGGKAKLEYTICGKPTLTTYVYGERALREYNERIRPSGKIETVYMVGDNPESDIAGANTFKSPHGTKWKSILVETGVHVAGSEPNHRPYHTTKDVMGAVLWALGEEGLGTNGSSSAQCGGT